MKLLHRNQPTETEAANDYYDERPLPDEAPEPQPEHEEPRLQDAGPTHLSKRDYLAITKRAFKKFNADHMTNIAAALAYYAFMAIPATLLIVVGLFGLLANPSDVTTVIDKLQGIVPSQATQLLEGSLRNLTQNSGTSITVLSIGGVLAF